MANILVVDDDAEILGLVGRSLNRDDHTIALAASVAEARDAIRKRIPDLIILDINLPTMPGYDFCREIRRSPATRFVPVIFLSAMGKPMKIVEALDAGGDDYIKKPFEPSVLNARVRAHLRRRPPQPDHNLIVVGDLKLDTDTCQLTVRGETPVRLTPMEFKLMEHLMRSPGQPQSVDVLLDAVWEYPPGTGDPDLVRAHIRNLRSKVEPTPRNPTYIVTRFRHGYMIEG